MAQDDQTPHEPPIGQDRAHAPLEAVCGVCGQALDEARDDVYAELCATCEQRTLKFRQRRARLPPRRTEHF